MFPSDAPDQEYEIPVGSTVVTADGHPVGRITAIALEAVTVEQDDPTGLARMLPWGLMASCTDEDDTVRLTVPHTHIQDRDDHFPQWRAARATSVDRSGPRCHDSLTH